MTTAAEVRALIPVPGQEPWGDAAVNTFGGLCDLAEEMETGKAPADHVHDGGDPILIARGAAGAAPAPGVPYVYVNTTNGNTELRDAAGALTATLATRAWFAPRLLPSLFQDDQDPLTLNNDWGLPQAPSGLAAWGWADFSPWLAGVAWRLALRVLLATSRSTTNKCTNHNANPTDLTNVVKLGDAAATLSVVDDTAALRAAGLDWLCTGGKAYKLDNSGGAGYATVKCNGVTGNTNKHSVSAWIRVTAGAGNLKGATVADPGWFSPITSAAYQRYEKDNWTPGSTADYVEIVAAAGAVVYFVLNQLEEAAACTHEVVVAGSSASSAPKLALNVAYQVNPAAAPVKARWRPSTVYGLGARVIPLTPNGHYYECTTAGTTAATPPTWPSSGTVSDGTVVWTRTGAGLKHLGVVTTMPATALDPTDIDTISLQIPAGEAAVGDVVIFAVWRPAGAAHDAALIQAVWPYPVEV